MRAARQATIRPDNSTLTSVEQRNKPGLRAQRSASRGRNARARGKPGPARRDRIRGVARAEDVDAIEPGERLAAGRRRRSARQSESTIASRSAAGSRASSRAAVRSASARSVRPLPRSDEQVVDERGRRADLALALEDERVGGERDHARARRARSRGRARRPRSAIAARPTAWPRIEPLWSTSRQSARRGAVQRRATSSSSVLRAARRQAQGSGRGRGRPRSPARPGLSRR